MYRHDCPYDWQILCLTTVGYLFTILFTYSGFACLIGGTLWAADVVPKIRRAWGQIRAGGSS
jgi:hypothetical protein